MLILNDIKNYLKLESAKYWIKKLDLEKHPEGGWFKETYRSVEIIPQQALPSNFNGDRNYSTCIYYLLESDDYSSFHRIRSDEMWHYYMGNSPIEIISLVNGNLKKQLVGNNPNEDQHLQIMIPKNIWFAARLVNKNGYALVGCTVSPGFHFDDFEMADEKLLEEYPKLENEIKKLVRFK